MMCRHLEHAGGAKTFDAQAGAKAPARAVIHSGAHYMWHSADWNEAGIHCSVAKFIVDAEQCAMAYRMAEGPKWDDFDAFCAVGDVGPRSLSGPSTYAGISSRRLCLNYLSLSVSRLGGQNYRADQAYAALYRL